MPLFEASYKSYNQKDYTELVGAKNMKEARKLSLKYPQRQDDRDILVSIRECTEKEESDTLNFMVRGY